MGDSFREVSCESFWQFLLALESEVYAAEQRT